LNEELSNLKKRSEEVDAAKVDISALELNHKEELAVREREELKGGWGERERDRDREEKNREIEK
jgi:hypothetical protein